MASETIRNQREKKVSIFYVEKLRRLKAFEYFVLHYQLCHPGLQCLECLAVSHQFLYFFDNFVGDHQSLNPFIGNNPFICNCKACFAQFVKFIFAGNEQIVNVSGEFFFFPSDTGEFREISWANNNRSPNGVLAETLVALD